MFRKITPQQRRAQQLRDAEMSLIDTEVMVETWTAQRDMLLARIARLRSEQPEVKS